MFIKDSNGCYLLEVPVSADQIIEKAKILLSRRFRRGTALSSPNDTRDYLQIEMAGLEREIFGVIYLDNRHKIIDRKNVFFGTIDGASVYPREIVVYEYLNKLCSTSFLRGMMTMKKINDGKSKE